MRASSLFQCIPEIARRAAPQRRTFARGPELRAFSDGFLGSLAGGLVYCLAIGFFQPASIDFALPRLLALSLIFGGFELWRVSRKRTLRNVRTHLLWTCIASLFALLAFGALRPSANGSRHEPERPPGSYSIAART